MMTTAYDQINNSNYIGLILLDFKKAFDTVCHKTLLSQLEHYSIHGVAYKLICSVVICVCRMRGCGMLSLCFVLSVMPHFSYYSSCEILCEGISVSHSW